MSFKEWKEEMIKIRRERINANNIKPILKIMINDVKENGRILTLMEYEELRRAIEAVFRRKIDELFSMDMASRFLPKVAEWEDNGNIYIDWECIPLVSEKREEIKEVAEKAQEALQNAYDTLKGIYMKQDITQMGEQWLYDFVKDHEGKIAEELKQQDMKKVRALLKPYLEKYKQERYKSALCRSIEEETIEPSCTAEDVKYMEPELEKDRIRVFVGSGSGGYSSRYTKIFYEVKDIGFIDGEPAVLFVTGIATYYGNSIRGVQRKAWIAGIDDGHLYLTQTYTSAETVQEAIDKIIPAAVKKARAARKEVRRQGDLWFVKTNKNQNEYAFEETEIRPDHIGLYDAKSQVATGVIKHPEHGELDLEDAVWKVYMNHTVSRQRVYSD